MIAKPVVLAASVSSPLAVMPKPRQPLRASINRNLTEELLKLILPTSVPLAVGVEATAVEEVVVATGGEEEEDMTKAEGEATAEEVGVATIKVEEEATVAEVVEATVKMGATAAVEEEGEAMATKSPIAQLSSPFGACYDSPFGPRPTVSNTLCRPRAACWSHSKFSFCHLSFCFHFGARSMCFQVPPHCTFITELPIFYLC